MEVVFAIFIVIVGILCLVLTVPFLRSRERMRLIELVRASADKGQPIPPEVLSTLAAEPKPQRPSHIRDFRRGVVLLSVALAIELFAICLYWGLTLSETDPTDLAEVAGPSFAIAGIGALPLCVGLAFLLLGLVGRNSAEP